MAQQTEDQNDDCPSCDGKGYFIDDYLGQSLNCSACAGTGIKDFAENLPPASVESVIAELRVSEALSKKLGKSN